MYFPDSYFEDEVQEGFYVPGLMKRAWAASLEVLDAVSKACRKHQITYFVEWGTLLGAIRHGGIVPWDDDIDICMKRKDYEKFLEVAEEALPEGYMLSSYRNSNTDNIVTKIVAYPTYLIRNEDLPRFHGYPYVPLIDLFVMDFIPRDKETGDAFYDLVQLAGELNDSIPKNDMKPETIEYALGIVEKTCGFSFDREKPMTPQLMIALDTVATRFQEENSDELTTIAYYMDSRSYRFPKSYYSQAIQMPFENIEVPVPVEYGKLLEKKYNNYMTPYRAFDTHEYPSYKATHKLVNKLIKEKVENEEIQFFQYRFSKQEMEQAAQERLPKETLRKKVQDILPLFHEAHEEIRERLQKGDFVSVAEILGECQNVAIQIGTMIEEECGEDHATVHILEQYCEMVFNLHEKLNEWAARDGMSGLPDEFQELADMEKRLAESANQDIKEQKEVVFIPYKTAYWNAMESVWQAAMEDGKTDVYVIPAPYYYKDDYGKIKKDEPHYETDYPANVQITSYEDYNFEVHHPDQIIIQCPYDEYSYGLTIHPFFYARNLKKYTDKLVFIPPFLIDEIQPEDGRGRVTLRYLCNTPGVVHADQVIVQSEMMKDVYVELLTEFAGEETKEMWEDKIVGLGSPVKDQEGTDPFLKIDPDSIPEEWHQKIWCSDGSRKKVILYATNVSVLFSYGDQAIHKMQEVFKLFRENQDEIVMWWRPDPQVREVLRKTKPGVLQKYRDLLQEYKEAGWGIYDDSKDVERAVYLCDAYYGDAGSTANMCRVQKKPVMFQNTAV